MFVHVPESSWKNIPQVLKLSGILRFLLSILNLFLEFFFIVCIYDVKS